MQNVTMPNNLNPVAFLIGNSDQEMIAGYKIRKDFIFRVYTKEAFLAHRFPTIVHARRLLKQLDRPELFIVPMFDFGDKFAVAWP